jgi:hypothetical protein
MKKIYLVIGVIITVFVVQSCASVAPTQFYRPQNHSGEAYRISDKLEPMSGWAGKVTITINDQPVNDQPVITESLPVFSNSTEAKGSFQGKTVTAFITEVTSFLSSYIRADVHIENERAATLAF